jgi:hypothetical protein
MQRLWVIIASLILIFMGVSHSMEKDNEVQEDKSYLSPFHGYGVYYREFNSGETPGISVSDLDLSFEKNAYLII